MPADDVMVCERACTLRTTRDMGDHCKFFIFNKETRECQLLASNAKTCFLELGPALEKRACFFSKLQLLVLWSIPFSSPICPSEH
jgi:hypothetical protein